MFIHTGGKNFGVRIQKVWYIPEIITGKKGIFLVFYNCEEKICWKSYRGNERPAPPKPAKRK